jgi:hypothetical protein
MPAKREIDYDKVAYLARRLVPQKIIACRIGFTETGLSKRKKRDKQLQEALDGGYDDAKIGLYVAQYRKALDHYMTICRDCGKISDGEFLESCPYCDKLNPKNEGQHTHVRHKFIEADTSMLIHLGKVHLGQSDKAILKITGDAEQPMVYKNLTEPEIDKKLAGLLPFLIEEYGMPGRKEQVVEILQP